MNDPIEQFPQVAAICISSGGIPKRTVEAGHVTTAGLQRDGHNHAKHNTPVQAISLQDEEVLEQMRWEGFPLYHGSIGENLTVRNLDVQKLPIGTVLEFSGGVVLELTKERKPCYVLDIIDPRLKDAIIGRCGFYARVIQEGFIKVGESIEVKEICRTI